MAPTQRYRSLVWTWNNYPENWKELLGTIRHVKYLVGGEEVAPTTGTPHIQGYVEFDGKRTWDDLKTIGLNNIQPRRGTAKQAADYCMKDGKCFTIGTQSNQGKRTDIELACDIIKSGETLRKVAEEHPVVFVKYHKGLQALKSILVTPRTTMPDVTVLWGRTGTGKSRMARELTKDPYVWGPEQGSWFDGYEGQSDVIFEEFRGQLPFGTMLRLLDRYDCRVQVKGGSIQFVATNIVITSPKPPEQWFFDDGHDKTDQLMRRIKVIHELK